MAIYRVNKPRHAQGKFHVKKNDEVVVLSGTQQGQRGKVLEVLRDRSRVIIEGVNFIKRHTRKSPNQPEGGIVEREGALHISKVMLATEYDKRRTASSSSSTAKADVPAETAAAEKPAKKTAAKKK
jgi:large subunit ribosomal protein L24